MRVEQVPLLVLVQNLDGGNEDSGGGGKVGSLVKRYIKSADLYEAGARRASLTLRVCFSNTSSLSSASWILPAWSEMY